MKKILLLLLLSLQVVSGQEPVPLSDAILTAREDVKASTEELNQLRDEIQQARVPMVQQLDEFQKQVAALRKEVSQIRSARNLRQNQLQNLKREVSQLQQENDFVDTVFSEYRRSLETRVGLGELSYVQAFVNLPPEELWSASAKWLMERRGGYETRGMVLDGTGIERKGAFYNLGPVSYFVDYGDAENILQVEDSQSGLVVSRTNSALPGVHVFHEKKKSEIFKLGQTKEAILPVDVSGGDALKVQQAKPSVVEQLEQGGVVVIPLLLLGVLAIILSVKKTVSFFGLRVTLGTDELKALEALSDENAESTLQSFNSVSQPLSSLLVAAVQHRKASRAHLEEILHEHVLAVVPRLESSLGALAVLGGVAPLLGLLGTVTGMIHTFMLVKVFGTGNTQTLSGGISEALVTTALGLMLAIPILLVHAVLTRKAKVLLGKLEQSGVTLVNVLKSDLS
ncbi:MotA/TolQ/ExbB proton channel family protein [Kiritimatiellaeota bacterium B1221]|nr:MotA/TolQ/ExbB proton channel family protein [Kiritimatiellaeota bacterium B1221]